MRLPQQMALCWQNLGLFCHRDAHHPNTRHPIGWFRLRVGRRPILSCMILYFMLQAVLYDTPICRLSAKADNPVLACVIKWIAKNQVVNGSLVCSKIVPLISEV